MNDTVAEVIENFGLPPAVIALIIAALVFLVLLGARKLVRTRGRRLAEATAAQWDDLLVDVVGGTRLWMLVAVACLVGASNMPMPERIATWLTRVVMALFFLQVGLWASQIARVMLERRLSRSLEHGDGAATTMAVVGFIVRLALWSVILILILDQLGFDVTTLVASLGIGGIAVALAVQNILSDLFGSLSIALDKPFLMGDFVVVGDIAGTVEHVGLKTTRIRALTGEQVVVANADLLGSRIHNYKRMDQRRIVFGFGVTYDTPADKLERLPGIVREIIEAQQHARFDRAHFKAFGASSLDYEVVYFVTVADYNRFMDTQQGINLGLVRRLKDEGIDFAFPTQTLHLASVPKALRMAADGTRASQDGEPDTPPATVWTAASDPAGGAATPG